MTDGRIIVSEYNGMPVVTSLIGNKLEFISFVRENDLNNIYLGKVDHIVKNINAAFIKYNEGKIGYLPLNKISGACVTSRALAENDSLKCGDEIIVQIDAEAIKTKKEKLSTSLCLSGKYSVITLGRNGVGSSLKLDDALRQKLVLLVKNNYEDIYNKYSQKLSGESVGVIIRTEAGELADLTDEEILKILLEDIDNNLSLLLKIIEQGKSRTIYSKLYSANSGDKDILEINIEKAKNFLKTRGIENADILQDTGIHGINSKIQELTQNKVWLKSGAYLIIEQLESFNAIDVNTGKAIKGKHDIAESVNMEAAEEIMRQIRLRNLSGMILVDFINMKDESQYEGLIAHICSLCRKDPVHTAFIDVTGLGIMELTRNKNDKSLKEILQNTNKVVDN
jgi:ribonuclease G